MDNFLLFMTQQQINKSQKRERKIVRLKIKKYVLALSIVGGSQISYVLIYFSACVAFILQF